MKREMKLETAFLASCLLTFIAAGFSTLSIVWAGIDAFLYIPPTVLLASGCWWLALQQVRAFVAALETRD